ncbi:V-set and immunoglobulin domain-containing protein 10 [Triplophysa dalaica]|uniref:V-set and immunoglobulin domain-containing protein 10 n=1 Tax=Triplophysa dalaica TaxID=1582913 RepID=UPI0024DF4173|nr:V-set and immunoglobulin domain-containing protein 10 [Triplophysa dalaica]
MRIITTAFYLLLISHETVTEEQVQYVIGEKGENATLQCNQPSVNASALVYRWKKDGAVAIQMTSVPSNHFSILNNGNLKISGLKYIDGGTYECESQTVGDRSWQTSSKVQLQIADGPTNVVIDIKPATALKNGKLYVKKGSDVLFNCSSKSQPAQNLTWLFEDSASNGAVDKGFGNESSLTFSISNIQPGDQGIYRCIAQNTLSMRTEKKNQELLVYYAPERHPECSWAPGNGPSDIVFICSWYGGYPAPTLEWHEVLKPSVIAKGPTVNSTSQETDRLEVNVNRFILEDSEEVKCVGSHVTGVQNSCSFTLKIPYPLGDPMVTALGGTNVTLRCYEINSLPPAKTVWKRNNTVINSTSKYTTSENNLTYTLTIINVTKDDEGIFTCYSENPLGARELDVYLTVKTTADSGGVVVGIFVSVLIIMIGIVVGMTVYSKRDRICIGLGFTSLSDDRGDVISLVDSDEEEIFHDVVPRLPQLTNRHATTLVEIHRRPSNEDTADSSEFTDQTEGEQ